MAKSPQKVFWIIWAREGTPECCRVPGGATVTALRGESWVQRATTSHGNGRPKASCIANNWKLCVKFKHCAVVAFAGFPSTMFR